MVSWRRFLVKTSSLDACSTERVLNDWEALVRKILT
jgi:hypothetical protein